MPINTDITLFYPDLIDVANISTPVPNWDATNQEYKFKILKAFESLGKTKKEETDEQCISSISQHREEIFDLLDPYIHSRFKTGSTFIMNKSISELKTDEDWVCLLNTNNKKILEEILEDGKKYLSLDIVKSGKTNKKYPEEDRVYYIFRYGALNLICIFENNLNHYLSWAYSTYLSKEYKIHNKRDRVTLFNYNMNIVTSVQTEDVFNFQTLIPRLKLNLKDCRDYLNFVTCKTIPQHIKRTYLTGY